MKIILLAATEYGKFDIVKSLIKENESILDFDRNNDLMYNAILSENIDIIKYLYKYGMNVTSKMLNLTDNDEINKYLQSKYEK